METKHLSPSHKRNLLHGRPLSFGDRDQIKAIRQHQQKVSGLQPVAVPAFRWSKLVFFFDCVNNRCRRKNLHKYNTRFISNLLGSALNCPGCGHLYCFQEPVSGEGKTGLYYGEVQA